MKTWEDILRVTCDCCGGEGDGCVECFESGWSLPYWVNIIEIDWMSEKAEALAPYLEDLKRLQSQAERLELMMPRSRDRIRREFESAVRSVDKAARAALESLEASA